MLIWIGFSELLSFFVRFVVDVLLFMFVWIVYRFVWFVISVWLCFDSR